MRLTGSLLAAALVVAGTAFVAPRASTNGERQEIARIRVHFDSVLASLPAKDVSALTASQRAHRSALMETLAAYRGRGVFPHNYDFPGQAVPYFVDRKTGTLCAVAHLLESTGRRDIVDRVAALDNNVRVPELKGDTAFTAWLDDHGLTLDEAAFIQVPYVQPETPAQRARNAAFIVAAPVALGGALVTSAYNALGNRDGHSTFGRRSGVVFGVLTAATGAWLMTKTDAPVQVGASAVFFGTASAVLAGQSMKNHQEVVAREEAEKSARTNVTASAGIAPTVDANGAKGARLSVSLRF